MDKARSFTFFIRSSLIRIRTLHNNANHLNILKVYSRTWKLNPNTTKTEIACFSIKKLVNIMLKVQSHLEKPPSESSSQSENLDRSCNKLLGHLGGVGFHRLVFFNPELNTV